MLSDATRGKIETLKQRYPQTRSALIPSLYLAQEEVGYVSHDVLRELACIFGLFPNEVYEVASFYTMFFKKPAGKYVIHVCTNISCLLCRGEEIMAHLQARLGIKPGDTTPDGRFTLLEVECLASCGTAPVVQINGDYCENVTTAKLDQILDSLP
jgi:NADH-quinone oxidoreductase E subunit